MVRMEGEEEKRLNTNCGDLDFMVWMEGEEKRGLLCFFF